MSKLYLVFNETAFIILMVYGSKKKEKKKIYNIKPTDQSLKKVIRLLWSSISSSVIGVTIMADTLVLRTK